MSDIFLPLPVAGCFDRFVNLAVGVALCLSFTLVVILFTAAQTELDLASAVLIEIDRERYEGQALLGLYCAIELVDLFFVHQKSADAERVNIVPVALLVRRNMHTRHHKFTFAGDLGIALLDTDAALAYRLDLSTGEHDAGLEAILDKVVVVCFLVIRDYFFALFCHSSVFLSRSESLYLTEREQS